MKFLMQLQLLLRSAKNIIWTERKIKNNKKECFEIVNSNYLLYRELVGSEMNILIKNFAALKTTIAKAALAPQPLQIPNLTQLRMQSCKLTLLSFKNTHILKSKLNFQFR